jgi:hypothetical protein
MAYQNCYAVNQIGLCRGDSNAPARLSLVRAQGDGLYPGQEGQGVIESKGGDSPGAGYDPATGWNPVSSEERTLINEAIDQRTYSLL